MNSSFRVFCCITALICSFVCLLSLSGAYIIICIIPLFFILFVYFTNIIKSIWLNRPLTGYILTLLLWIRMVMLPFYGTTSGAYGVSAALELQQNLLGSVFLCLYDSCSIAFILLIASTHINNKQRLLITKGLYGQKEVYIVFCVFALIVFFTVGRHMHLFDFVIKPIGADLERVGDITDNRTLIVRSIVDTGVSFLFFLFINRLYKQYNETLSNKYFRFSIICAILLVSIIIGERRTVQLYKGFASVFLLISLYPNKSKKVVSTVGVFAFVVLALMTVYKQFNAFLYDSYSEAIQNASINRGFSYKNIDSYFMGIDTIAKNLYYGKLIHVNFSQLVYELFRNVFGLSFLVSDGRLLTTQMYNNIIYSGDQLTGLLLTSVGYGYIFGGYILAPFATVFNIIIMLFFEKCLRNSKTLEWKYVFTYVFIRFAFGVLSSPPPLINLVTRMIIIYGITILIARFVKLSIE